MALFENLPNERFRTLVIDPPWKYGDNLPGSGRGASKHYRTLTIDEIRQLPVPDLAERQAHLWVWTTNGFIKEALELIDDWGFTYKTKMTWCKTQIGMGWFLRNTTEDCLFAVRGNLRRQPGANNIPSHFVAARTKHSRKPNEAYVRIARISPETRLDMFAREYRPGFQSWGDELGESQEEESTIS